jgi:hypothetical protein
MEYRLEVTPETPGVQVTRREAWLQLAGPNPFHTRVALRIWSDRLVDDGLRIVDLSGRLVRHVPVRPGGGLVNVVWDGTNEGGKRVPPGFYFVTALFTDGRQTRRLVRV